MSRNDLSHDPDRDEQLEVLFGTDYKFVTKLKERKLYSTTICMKSTNPTHYTEYGWIKSLEKSHDPGSIKRTLSFWARSEIAKRPL